MSSSKNTFQKPPLRTLSTLHLLLTYTSIPNRWHGFYAPRPLLQHGIYISPSPGRFDERPERCRGAETRLTMQSERGRERYRESQGRRRVTSAFISVSPRAKVGWPNAYWNIAPVVLQRVERVAEAKFTVRLARFDSCEISRELFFSQPRCGQIRPAETELEKRSCAG